MKLATALKCQKQPKSHKLIEIVLPLIRVREDRRKISGYAENTIPFYLLDDFQRFFRISRGTFEIILRNVAPALTPDVQRGRPYIKPREEVIDRYLVYFPPRYDTQNWRPVQRN